MKQPQTSVQSHISRSLVVLAVLTSLFMTGPLPALGQIPDEFKNLKVLPKDISKDDLVDVMRHFSFALGVRCQYCHTGGDGRSFEGVAFDNDDDPDKRKARFMMRMTENLNSNILPQMPERDEPPLVIECKTCHRGRERPFLLTQELRLVLDQDGADAAVARYRELRESAGNRGAYDFGEWEMNTLAEDLAKSGRPSDAIAIYELNAEFHAESSAIQAALGELYESIDDAESAIAHYERALELRPGERKAAERLEALRAKNN